jgi:hypothetical protein
MLDGRPIVVIFFCVYQSDTCFTFREENNSQMFEEKTPTKVSGCNKNEINVNLGS